MKIYPLVNPTYTSIPATKWSRRVEIQEDGLGPRVGLMVKFPDDNFTQVFTYAADKQPIIIGDVVAHAAGRGITVGRPGQTGYPATTATELCRITCAMGSVNIRVDEID